MTTNPIKDLKIVISLIMAGGPRGVAEQRIVQTKLNSVMRALHQLHDQAKGSDSIADLEATNAALVDSLNQALSDNSDLQEKLELITGEIDRLKGELKTERGRVTRLTNKLEEQDAENS